jgi:hypothetical protein
MEPSGGKLGGAQTRWFSPRRRCEPSETYAVFATVSASSFSVSASAGL